MREMTIGQFFPGTSFVHRLDPRTKLLIMLAYIVLVFLVKGFVGYGVLAVFLLAACLSAKVKLGYLLKTIKPILFIVLLTFVLNIFFTTGETPLIVLGPVKIYPEGIRFAVMMALRLVFLLMGTSLLTLTTSPMALTDALERLLKPLKKLHFPVHELSMMMTIALRFIPTLMEETDKIMKAQAARGADFDTGNLFDKAKAMLPLLVPLFVSAFRRADDLALAMEARCYHGGDHRTRMKELNFTEIDAVAALLTVLVTCGIIAERIFL